MDTWQGSPWPLLLQLEALLAFAWGPSVEPRSHEQQGGRLKPVYTRDGGHRLSRSGPGVCLAPESPIARRSTRCISCFCQDMPYLALCHTSQAFHSCAVRGAGWWSTPASLILFTGGMEWFAAAGDAGRVKSVGLPILMRRSSPEA